MSTPRIVTLTLDEVGVDVLFFNVRFRVTGATSWTDYFTSGAGLEDLSVSLLSDTSYILDGVNGATGNMALASSAGNEFQVRKKTSGGYGNWADPFKAIWAPDDDGPLADVAKLIRRMSDLKTMLDFDSQENTDVFLGETLAEASDELRLNSYIDGLYTQDLTLRSAAQTRKLSAAELLIAEALVFEKAMGMKATGMQAPLLMEESSELQARAVYFRGRASEVLVGIIEEVVLPFSLPTVFTTVAGCRGR